MNYDGLNLRDLLGIIPGLAILFASLFVTIAVPLAFILGMAALIGAIQ